MLMNSWFFSTVFVFLVNSCRKTVLFGDKGTSAQCTGLSRGWRAISQKISWIGAVAPSCQALSLNLFYLGIWILTLFGVHGSMVICDGLSVMSYDLWLFMVVEHRCTMADLQGIGGGLLSHHGRGSFERKVRWVFTLVEQLVIFRLSKQQQTITSIHIYIYMYVCM